MPFQYRTRRLRGIRVGDDETFQYSAYSEPGEETDN